MHLTIIKPRSAVCGFLLILAVWSAASPAGEPGKLFGQSPSEFAARRAAVRSNARDSIVLFFGPGDNGDIGRIRFRTDNNLMYLTGVEASNACLALLPPGDPSGKTEILFLPEQTAGQKQWMDPLPGPDSTTKRATGMYAIRDIREIWDVLRPSIEKAGKVLINGPVGQLAQRLPDGSDVGVGAVYFPNQLAEAAIRKLNPGIKIEGEAEQMVHRLRWRKSAGEIANLRAAIAATGAAERSAARNLREGATEVSIEGAILAEFRKGGALHEGFPSIVGSGPNSTILHHFAGDRRMKRGEVVVIDIGAEYNYYSADVTRTFPVGGRFTARQKKLYQLVLDTQTACHRHVKPGATTLSDLHQFAVSFLQQSPLRARDSSGNVHTMDFFFTHGLGHWLGMDVHDVSGGSMILQPGTVFTIEPGVYIPSEGIGIRIEDDYLVTKTGVEKLSAAVPSDPAQVEALAAPLPPAAKHKNG